MPRQGQQHHNAKLTDAQVKEMREMRKRKPSIYSYCALADRFGCGESTVRDILKYKTRINVID